MRRIVAAALTAALWLGGAAEAGPSVGGVSSDNIEYVTTVPYEAGVPSGARLVGKHLYVAGARSFSIYDVSDPLSPSLESITPTGAQFPNEDVDTNGSILLISDEQIKGVLQIYDVEDKAAPQKLAEIDAPDHTFTCVLRCKWAYGARGTIVDLRDPADPQVAGNWMPGMTPGFGFDVTEVAPGLILTASRVIHLLDARKDPANPKALAYGSTPDNRLIHSNLWPTKGRAPFFLVQGETPFSQRCEADSGAFMTWDARDWRKTSTFQIADEYRVTNGTYVDGNPPANAAGCTTMWFDDHPGYAKNGLVASAFFEHGTRLLQVDQRDGSIAEVGYFMPHGGSTIATYWITDEIVYAIDFTRGIDVLRVAAD